MRRTYKVTHLSFHRGNVRDASTVGCNKYGGFSGHCRARKDSTMLIEVVSPGSRIFMRD